MLDLEPESRALGSQAMWVDELVAARASDLPLGHAVVKGTVLSRKLVVSVAS